MILYHGTRGISVDSILRDGLRPGPTGLVWATESLADAQTFANGLDYPESTEGGGVVLVIEAPKEAFFWERPMRRCGGIFGRRVARFATTVPAAWISKEAK